MKAVAEAGFFERNGLTHDHFLQDILRQPLELQSTIDYLCGAGAVDWRRPRLRFGVHAMSI